MTLYFASHNKNKAQEIVSLLRHGIQLKTLDQLQCFEDIPETSDTLQGNAFLKANYVAGNFGVSCFADDTGLEIDALNGAPGVYSARYAGDAKNTDANMDKVLKNLEQRTNRTAQFRTVICLILNKEIHYFEGIIRGEISTEKRGAKGFGYDPIFIPEGSSITFAEMTLDEKNTFSHRARAIAKMVAFLNEKIAD